MTNAILLGKPDAGNPHVRIDEGEVASAKPRRGSLLYNLNSITRTTAKLAVGAALATGLAAESRASDWIYYAKSEKGNPLSNTAALVDPDTGWAFRTVAYAVTVGETSYAGLTVQAVGKSPDDKALAVDFRNKKIFDTAGEEKTIVALGDGNGNCFSGVQTLYLPDTLRELRFKCFLNNTTITTIEPLVPDSVVTCGQQVFSGCTSLTGDFSLQSGAVSQSMCVNCALLTSVTLGKAVTSIGPSAFSGCAGLTNIAILCESALSMFGAGCFTGTTNVRELKVGYKQDFKNAKNFTQLWGWTDYQAKLRVLDTTLSSWKTADFVAWGNLDADIKAEYAARFPGDPEVPLGTYALPTYTDSAMAKKKQWLVTYKQDLGDVVKLTVQGEFNDAVPTPRIGTADYVLGDDILCTNTQYCAGAYNDNNHNYRVYECWAGVLERFVDDVWGEAVTNECCSFVFKPTVAAAYRLTWLWKQVGYTMPSVAQPTVESAGRVIVKVPPVHGWWCEANESVTYELVDIGADATFERWYGDVSGDQIYNTEVTVLVSSGRLSLKPQVTCPYWVFDESAHTLADGGWKIGTTTASTRNAIALGGNNTTCVMVKSPDQLLDFTKPVKDGGKIVSFGYHTFTKYNNEDREPREIRLPKCFREIGSAAFYNNSGRTTNIVFNSYPTIDAEAFPVNTRQMLWQVVPNAGWTAFAADPAKLVPWNACGPTTQATWKAEGKLPAGLTVGFNNQWLRFLPASGMKVLFR